MRLQRIYSSKVYLTSSRKDKIHAAMQDPINAELVRQLSDYLDDEGKVELKHALNEQEAEENAAAANSGSADTSDDFGGGSDFGGGGSHAPSHGGSAFTGDIMSDFGEDALADVEPIDMDSDEGAPEPEPELAASKTVNGKPITATSVIWTSIEDIANECETIKGTLNAREDTSGVNRLQVKDQELWIYFTDDTNLNDKMIDVIEVLNGTGYTYLAFSRLARSNNAIVFDINLNTQEQVKTNSELEDTK